MRKEVLVALAMLVAAGLTHAQEAPAPFAVSAPVPDSGVEQVGFGGKGAFYIPYATGSYHRPYSPGSHYYPYLPGNLYSPHGNGYATGPAPGFPDGAPYQVPYAASLNTEVEVWDTGPERGAEVTYTAPPMRPETCWINVNYLLAWTSKAPLNTPLVTFGQPTDDAPGALGQPGTVVAFGQDQLDFDPLHGIRAEIGTFLDPDHIFSIDVSGFYFFQGEINSRFASDAAGDPLITRPVFNTLFGENRSFLTSTPGALAGSTTVEADLSLWGVEGNVRCNAHCTPFCHVDFLIGMRQLRLDENLSIRDRVIPLSPNNISFLGAGNPVDPPNSIADQDRFSTSNNFYGGNLGARVLFQKNWFFVSLAAKVALGVTTEKVDIQGSTSLVTPAGVRTVPGGILALPTNSGIHRSSVMGLVPEGTLTFGIQPCKNVRLLAGYSYLWWNHVARPGRQIDPNINPTLVSTDRNFGRPFNDPRPTFQFRDQSFWLQSLTVGLELYY